jgi:hypothetical protein
VQVYEKYSIMNIKSQAQRVLLEAITEVSYGSLAFLVPMDSL